MTNRYDQAPLDPFDQPPPLEYPRVPAWVPFTGWVCRAHLWPVNHRGYGCPHCTAETRRRPRRDSNTEQAPRNVLPCQ